MIVILCHPGDHAALWLHGALRAIGVGRLELVSVEQLVYSRKIIHRLDFSGDTGQIHLADGRVLHANAIGGLINRIRYLPTQHFAAADPADRIYATEELNAFMLAWLDGIAGRVINPAQPAALDGASFPAVTIAHMAAMAGLPTDVLRAGTRGDSDNAGSLLAPTQMPIVFDGRIFGPLLPRELQESCHRLATLIGVPLLQVALHRSNDGSWHFVGASGSVNFPAGGKSLTAAIYRALASPVPA